MNPGKRDPNSPNSTSIYRFIPMMVSRLCISLKKSADPRSAARIWHADHFSRAEGADVERFAMGPVERPTAGINDPETPC